MALADVSDALSDPDYVDQLQYIRTSVVSGANGRGVKEPSALLPFFGSVQAGGGDTLNRSGDAEYNVESIRVITKEPLIAGSGDITADIVVWGGNQYTVVKVTPWRNWGEGYIAADCDIKTLRGSAVQ